MQKSKLLIVVFVVIVIIILYCIFGFKEKTYIDGYVPGNTYYVYQSKNTDINYCKVMIRCSAVDCDSNYYSYEIHLINYFEKQNMIQIK